MIEITNRYHFRNLDELNFSWELTANGVAVQEGTVFSWNWQPGEKKLVQHSLM